MIARKDRISVMIGSHIVGTHALTDRGKRAALRQRYMLWREQRHVTFSLNGQRVEIDPETLALDTKWQ